MVVDHQQLELAVEEVEEGGLVLAFKWIKMDKLKVWCSLPLLPSPTLDRHLGCAFLSPLVQTCRWRGGGGGVGGGRGVEVDPQLLRHVSQLLPGEVRMSFECIT